MRFGLCLSILLVAVAGPVMAQTSNVRQLTPAEHSKIVDVLKAEGCTTFREARVVDDTFEVKDTRCGGDQLYDIVYDRNLKMIAMSEKPKN
ncbi:MAG TPA: hypothetical protein VHK03_11860 [Aestuariivirgaceae bacterium]|jgi:hypothetical protein|nr:hypothetical protein [Aestuariivirgaceae bacterium]